ncbi:MAG: PleD family two-component system response regulator, partial [bacterium]
MRTKQLLRRSIDILNDQTPSNIKKSSQKIMYLIGEDSGATQFVEHQIQSLGYEILLARNQSEAIAIAKYWKPLVIISEISLNNLKGFELCRLLKEDARTNSIPFFFISDQKVKPDQLLGFQMGADDYIIKPWEPNEFRSRLLSLIRRNTSEIKEGSPDFSDNKMNNDKGSTQLLDDEQNDQEISVNIHRIDQNPSNTDKEIQTSNVKHKYEDGKSL